MKYPYEFSPQDLARVEAERIKAKRELEKARSMEPPEDWPQRNWDYLAFNAYILRVFLAFGRAACALAARGQWQIDRVRDEAQKFLLRFTLQACGEEGRDRFGKAFPAMTTHDWYAALEPGVERLFRNSEEYRQFETELLAVAEGLLESVSDDPAEHLTQRQIQVDAFLRACQQETSVRVTRAHIWKAAGHRSPRQFQFWQARDPKATAQDDQNFQRILTMKPREFLDLLQRKGIITTLAA